MYIHVGVDLRAYFACLPLLFFAGLLFNPVVTTLTPYNQRVHIVTQLHTHVDGWMFYTVANWPPKSTKAQYT